MNIRCNATNKVLTVSLRLFIAAGKIKHNYLRYLFNTHYNNPYAEADAWID
jgi:hypothetical protein